ncbi:hypothetical protein [Streptomyces sp. NPDC087300]|uniref:hypothetical protein n=1 Tax=Streptomyces sp. NPDC087300 TaxID=3365780 RepID=UPI00382264D6
MAQPPFAVTTELAATITHIRSGRIKITETTMTWTKDKHGHSNCDMRAETLAVLQLGEPTWSAANDALTAAGYESMGWHAYYSVWRTRLLPAR